MTTRELDYKLAKDIARIRLITMAGDATVDTTISEQILAAMHDLDEAGENKIIVEIDKIMKDPAKAKLVSDIMTPAYVDTINLKLRIRDSLRTSSRSSKLKTFQDAERKQAMKENAIEVDKAAKIILKAAAANESTTIVNAAVAEAYGYNIQRTVKAITDQVYKDPGWTRGTEINLEVVNFMSLAHEAIEHLEKVSYYGSWYYERFQPTGIINVTIS